MLKLIWDFPVSFEIFADLAIVNSEVLADRNRFELGLGYRYNRDIKIKVLYTLQGTKNNIEGGINQRDHVLRLTVSQNFGFE